MAQDQCRKINVARSMSGERNRQGSPALGGPTRVPPASFVQWYNAAGAEYGVPHADVGVQAAGAARHVVRCAAGRRAHHFAVLLGAHHALRATQLGRPEDRLGRAYIVDAAVRAVEE